MPIRHNNCSQRTDSLAVSLPDHPITDVTSQTDFRGLFHADNEHALEALYPGAGHELSVEFRQRATASVKPGFPAPPAAQTPRKHGKKGSRERALTEDVSLTTESVPISRTRLDSVATRTHDDTLKKYSKAQFLSTEAPPPPPQRSQLLREDFSPKATLSDPGRVTGSFQRTEQGHLPHRTSASPKAKNKGMESLPPAQRSYTYPVLVTTTPTAKGAQALSGQASEMNSPMSLFQSQGSGSSPMRRTSNSNSFPTLSKRRPQGSTEVPSTAVCRELDQFEASMTCLPRVSNFFGTPRSHRRSAHMQGSIGSRSVSQGLTQDGLSREMSRSTSAPVMQGGF